LRESKKKWDEKMEHSKWGKKFGNKKRVQEKGGNWAKKGRGVSGTCETRKGS